MPFSWLGLRGSQGIHKVIFQSDLWTQRDHETRERNNNYHFLFVFESFFSLRVVYFFLQLTIPIFVERISFNSKYYDSIARQMGETPAIK